MNGRKGRRGRVLLSYMSVVRWKERAFQTVRRQRGLLHVSGAEANNANLTSLSNSVTLKQPAGRWFFHRVSDINLNNYISKQSQCRTLNVASDTSFCIDSSDEWMLVLRPLQTGIFLCHYAFMPLTSGKIRAMFLAVYAKTLSR